MLGSNLGDCCFWIVKFKWWIGQEPWSKGLTHDKRFDRVARTSCEDHLPYLGAGGIKVFIECSFLPTNFPVPAPKGQEVNYECVTLHLCNSQRVLIKIAIHNIAHNRNRTSLALTKAGLGAPPLFVLRKAFIFSRSTSRGIY